MIVVKKKMKRPLLIAILAAVLAVLTAAAILLDVFLIADNSDDTPKVEPPVVDKDAGEDIYNNLKVAYPRVEESHIVSMLIGGDRDYGITREYDIDNDQEIMNNPFVFYYYDDDGERHWYLPNIMHEDGGFEYDDLYAMEQNDGYGTIKKLTYLTSAFGALYFDTRMDIPTDEEARKKELSAFGFGEEDSPLTVVIRYNQHNEDGSESEVVHTVTVGSKLATNSGYYFMVDDRPYIYTTYTTYIDYAFIDFVDFINPILVAAGLPQDNAFEPYLTTDYQQYKNTLYGYDDGENPYSHQVVAGSDVIVSANVIKPDRSQFKVEGDDATVHVKGGLKVDTDEDVTFNLGKYSDGDELKKISDALCKMHTGKLASPLVITVAEYSNVAELGIKYTYKIMSIEAIITADGYNAPAGAVIAAGDSVKVKYELYKNDVKAFESELYGIVNLASEKVPQSLKNALIGRGVGSVAGDEFTCSIVYDTENSIQKPYKYVVERIIGISDAEGKLPATVKQGHKVLYRYDVYVNGELLYNDMIGEIVVNTESTDPLNKLLSREFIDKAIGDIRIEYKENINLELISSFSTFEIDEIKFFVVKEKIVSFKFQQASQRDPYYGESIYMNTTGGKYSLYALNSTSCEAVVRILGGLLTNANSSTGLVGTKTVDINITPEKMRKYGLYDYSVYFEFPRGIEAKVYDSSSTTIEQYLTNLDDYEYATTLGFNLYISKADPATGKRYIASDLYDVIAQIDANEDFIFLEQNFVDFYARKNSVLVNVEHIQNVKLEFMMDDKYGTYSNKLIHQETYAYGGGLYLKSQLTEGQLAEASRFDYITVSVTQSGNCMETELSRFLASHPSYSSVSFTELYGVDKTDRMDSLGTSYFKEFIETLFNTRYHGTLSAEEQANALASYSPVMRMSIDLVESATYNPDYRYVYEFYKISSRRVMVKISRIARNGNVTEVSDFYVSNFAFEKLCNKYFDLLNKKTVNNENVFKDENVIE